MWLPGRERKEKRGEGDGALGRWGQEEWSVPPLPQSLFSPGQIYNLGTGTGYSVLQMVRAMEKASGRKVGHPPAPALTLSSRPGPSH